MAKRKLSESVLKDVAELQSEAVAAKKAASEAQARDIEASRAYERMLNNLKLKIATGSDTTGVHLLDINIVVNGSVERDEQFDAMARLEKDLEPRGGELVAEVRNLAGTPQVEKIGILPVAPRLQLQVGGAFGRGTVVGGDASVRCAIPVLDESGVVSDLLVPTWEGPQGKPTLVSNIVFEAKLQWILENEPNMHLAVALWSNALALGRPLSAPERLMGEIMVRREGCALELQKLIDKLNSAAWDLKKTKENPSSWKLSQITFESGSATVTFADNIIRIERARRDLAQKLREAAKLGMAKESASPIYEKATKLLEDTKEWDA